MMNAPLLFLAQELTNSQERKQECQSQLVQVGRGPSFLRVQVVTSLLPFRFSFGVNGYSSSLNILE